MKLITVKSKKASAMILAFIVLAALLIYVTAFINLAINQNLSADIFKRRISAFDLAEAGIDDALACLRNYDSTSSCTPISATLSSGTYNAAITTIASSSANITRYKISSTGTSGNISRTLAVCVQVDNFARYLWFTDSETYGYSTVWFSTGDTLNGPTRTNNHFNISGDPIFSDEVSSVDAYLNFYNNGRYLQTQDLSTSYDSPTFAEAVNFGVEEIDYSSVANARDLKNAASASGGLYLTGNTTVVLNDDGTMNVTNSNKRWTSKNMALPTTGALYVNRGTLTISGTLNGDLTAGSSGNVIIPGNVVYSDKTSTSDDILGLISESNVVVSSSAPTNVEVDACIIALNTSFYVDGYDRGSPKGTLTIFGGIIQDQRGPVGTFNAYTDERVSGYAKNYLYDTRLLSAPPPYMPTTGDYIVLSWEEN